MEKKLYISRLKDYYSSLLTSKQNEVLEQYYNLDYSLSEIADNLSITRQAVHFALKNGTDTLENLEKKLGILNKTDIIERLVNDALEQKNADEKDNLLRQALEALRR